MRAWRSEGYLFFLIGSSIFLGKHHTKMPNKGLYLFISNVYGLLGSITSVIAVASIGADIAFLVSDQDDEVSEVSED